VTTLVCCKRASFPVVVVGAEGRRENTLQRLFFLLPFVAAGTGSP